MKYPLRFGIVACLMCSAFLFSQTNPSSTEHKPESKSVVTVSIFPHPNMEVSVGGSQVVTATVDGSTNTAVKWSISGSGCSGSACGTVSAGLYLAPSILPNPPTVKMTATSEADPNASDSITVHIGHSTLTSAWKQDAGNASFGLGPVLRVGGGVSAPHAVYAPDPEYSKEAREANYRGACILWLIVGTDGLPRNIKVVRSAGMGLDENALEAVKRWRFQPALKDGKPVAVQINVEVTFRPN